MCVQEPLLCGTRRRSVGRVLWDRWALAYVPHWVVPTLDGGVGDAGAEVAPAGQLASIRSAARDSTETRSTWRAA
jgi:hypothetical protein